MQMKLDVDGNLVPMTANDIASLPKPEYAPAPLPPLSPSQFAIALMKRGVINAGDAEEFAASGAIPPALGDLIAGALDKAGLKPEEQAVIRIKLRGALEYRRTDPAVPMIGAALGLDAAALDAMWAEGAGF